MQLCEIHCSNLSEQSAHGVWDTLVTRRDSTHSSSNHLNGAFGPVRPSAQARKPASLQEAPTMRERLQYSACLRANPPGNHGEQHTETRSEQLPKQAA